MLLKEQRVAKLEAEVVELMALLNTRCLSCCGFLSGLLSELLGARVKTNDSPFMVGNALSAQYHDRG